MRAKFYLNASNNMKKLFLSVKYFFMLIQSNVNSTTRLCIIMMHIVFP